jgi:hypothetical protein
MVVHAALPQLLLIAWSLTIAACLGLLFVAARRSR